MLVDVADVGMTTVGVVMTTVIGGAGLLPLTLDELLNGLVSLMLTEIPGDFEAVTDTFTLSSIDVDVFAVLTDNASVTFLELGVDEILDE